MTKRELHYRGVVLRTLGTSEADLIVAVLAEDGEKHVALAKQARKSRKRFGSSLDLFDFGRFEATQAKGNLPLLQSFIPEHGFRKLRDSLSKLACASVLVEATDLLIPESHGDISHQPIFAAVIDGLMQINDASDLKMELRALYLSISSILHLSGYHDPTQERAPSLHALRTILLQLEKTIERKLRSRETLELVAAELR